MPQSIHALPLVAFGEGDVLIGGDALNALTASIQGVTNGDEEINTWSAQRIGFLLPRSVVVVAIAG